MPTAVRFDRQKLADIDKPVADLVERFGFQWDINYEFPVPPENKRVQIREEEHYNPKDTVSAVADVVKRGDPLPAIVVTADGFIVDGNTRAAAHRRRGFPKIKALVLDANYEGASVDVRHRVVTLGAGFNARNGKGINRQEIRNAVEFIAEDPLYDGTRIAALLGVTDNTVQNIIAEKRGRDRAESLGLHVNGSLSASHLRALGRASHKLDDEPYSAVLSLAQDAGLSISEMKDIIHRLLEGPQSRDAKLNLVNTERISRREQIADYKARGKSKPPMAGLLRQRLGFVVGFQDRPTQLLEYNPDLVQSHIEMIQRSIGALQSLLKEQEALRVRSANH